MKTIKKAKIANGLENGHDRALELFTQQFGDKEPLYIIVPNGWSGRDAFFIASEHILTYSSGAKSIQYKIEARYTVKADKLTTKLKGLKHCKGELHTIIKVAS